MNVVKNTAMLTEGEIIIFNNNKILIQEIDKQIMKESDCTQKAGAVVEGIRREIKRSKIEIKTEYANNKLRPNLAFEQQLESILMK